MRSPSPRSAAALSVCLALTGCGNLLVESLDAADARAGDAGPGDAGSGDAAVDPSTQDASAQDASMDMSLPLGDSDIDTRFDAGFQPTGGFTFDGVDDRAEAPLGLAFPAGADWSLELWFRLPFAEMGAGPFFTAYVSENELLSYHFKHADTLRRSGIGTDAYASETSCVEYSRLADAQDDIYDRWVHLVISHDGNSPSYYYDGMFTRRNSQLRLDVGPAVIVLGGVRPCFTAEHSSLSLANVRIWSRGLTAAEVAALATGAPPAIDALGLVSWWPLDEGSGQSARNLVPGGPPISLGSTGTPEASDPTWN